MFLPLDLVMIIMMTINNESVDDALVLMTLDKG